MTPLYTWDGRHVGFRVDDHLYAADGTPFGWVDEKGEVWHADGRYLGELVEEAYVLRERSVTRHTRRRMHPTRPLRAMAVANRHPRAAHPNQIDGLAWLSDAVAAGGD